MNDEIKDFIQHWMPMAESFPEESEFDENYITMINGEMVAHLSMLYRVMVAENGDIVRAAPALHVGLICNAVVKAEWRGTGLMHLLKEQAHARARQMGFLFCVTISRWPARNDRYGYKPALNWHKYGMTLQLAEVPWPKGKVRITEGSEWT